MSRIISVTANHDYTLRIELEQGQVILFNMQGLIQSIPFAVLQDMERFMDLQFEDKAICWKGEEKQTIYPLRLTLDNILFALRD